MLQYVLETWGRRKGEKSYIRKTQNIAHLIDLKSLRTKFKVSPTIKILHFSMTNMSFEDDNL